MHEFNTDGQKTGYKIVYHIILHKPLKAVWTDCEVATFIGKASTEKNIFQI